MPKYIRRQSSSRSRSTDTLRDALLKDLEREGEKMLRKMTTQFSRDLEKESGRILQGMVGGSRGRSANTGAIGLDAVGSLVSTLIAYALNKPKTSTNTRESERSRNEASNFRLSRSQAMAEATAQLSRSDRNY